MQTFMFANYEGYMIWLKLQRDYEPMRIYIHRYTMIKNLKLLQFLDHNYIRF